MSKQCGGSRAVPGPLVVTAATEEVLRTADPSMLTVDERRRYAALRRPADRDAFLASHLLVRRCAAALTGRAPETLELVQVCGECGSRGHGRPLLAGVPDVHVSLAHTRGVVVAGAGWGPLGVDIESVDAPAPTPALMPELLAEAELSLVRSARDGSLAFLRYWVRKECLVKIGVAALDALYRTDLSGMVEETRDDGRTVGRYGALHVVHWVDESLGAVVATAGADIPVIGSLADTV
jgi:4'-phosphopantetheinyl transferase